MRRAEGGLSSWVATGPFGMVATSAATVVGSMTRQHLWAISQPSKITWVILLGNQLVSASFILDALTRYPPTP